MSLGPCPAPAGTESLRSSPATPTGAFSAHRPACLAGRAGTSAACAAHASWGPGRLCSPTGRGSTELVPTLSLGQHRLRCCHCRWTGTAQCHRTRTGGKGPQGGGTEAAGRVPEGPLACRLGTNQKSLFSLTPQHPRHRVPVQEKCLARPVPGTLGPSSRLCSLAPQSPARQSHWALPGSYCPRSCCCCGTNPASPPLSGQWSRARMQLSVAWSSVQRRDQSMSAAGRGGQEQGEQGPAPRHPQTHVTPSPSARNWRARRGEMGSRDATVVRNGDEGHDWGV